MEEQKKRGGKREGAGRKKTTARYYGYRATQEAMEIIEKVEGSKSAFINRCVLAYGEALSKEE